MPRQAGCYKQQAKKTCSKSLPMLPIAVQRPVQVLHKSMSKQTTSNQPALQSKKPAQTCTKMDISAICTLKAKSRKTKTVKIHKFFPPVFTLL